LKILISAKRRSNPVHPDLPVRDDPRRGRRELGLISWIAVGAIAGLLVRRVVPGYDPGRFVVAVILGMAGGEDCVRP
jgi:hypothetical protein